MHRPKLSALVRAITCVILATVSVSAQAITWTTINYPGALHTSVEGISGGKLVGSYGDDLNSIGHVDGFLYDGTTFTPLFYPGGSSARAQDIDGDMIVGSVTLTETVFGNLAAFDHAYRYDGSSWDLTDYPGDYPGVYNRRATGISGDKIVGRFEGNGASGLRSGILGYLYDGTSYTVLDYPGSNPTFAMDVDGDRVVGSYIAGTTSNGFMYEGGTWTELAYPGAKSTVARAIDGNNIVGSYYSFDNVQHMFLYDGTAWQTLDGSPWDETAVPLGIDGNVVVGQYYDDEYRVHGFTATIPEPGAAVLAVLAFGSIAMLRRRFG